MRSIVRGALGVALLSIAFGCSSGPAHAVNTQNVGLCDPAAPTHCVQPQADGSLNVNGSFSATLSGFTPNGNIGTPVSASTSSSRQQLPATSAVVLVGNKSSVPAYVKLGDNTVTATVDGIMVPAGGGCALTVGANTYIAAITASGSATLNTAGGTGLAQTCFGGGSGGGSGGTVQIDQTTPGTTNGVVVNSSALPTGAATAANQSTGNSSLATIATNSASQATAANQTTANGSLSTIATNTTNAGNPTIHAGSNIIGKISQVDSAGNDATDTTTHAVKVVGVGVAQGSTTSGQTLSPIGCRTLSSAPTDTSAQTNMPWCKTDGSLAVSIVAGAGSGGTASNFASSFPSAGTAAGCRTATAAPTANTDGQMTGPMCSTEGKLVNLPFAIKELMLRGANSATGTSATTFTGMGAQGASVKIYVTGVQCFRTDAGTTTSYVTLNDSASTPVILPVGGGSNVVFSVPLAVAANTAFQFTPHDALTTVFCSAQGYAGP